MIDVTHTEEYCGKVAFRLTHRPKIGDIMDPSTVVMPDGTTPQTGDKIVCGACGQPPATPLDLEIDGGYA